MQHREVVLVGWAPLQETLPVLVGWAGSQETLPALVGSVALQEMLVVRIRCDLGWVAYRVQ
jgi:hypothetical protein